MPHKISFVKDKLRGDASLAAAPSRSAESSEVFDGEIEHSATAPRKGVARSQTNDSSNSLAAITPIQYRRIVASLAAGHREKNIADGERIPERIVRRVRAAEIDRLNRQMSAVSVSFGGFLDNVRKLHSEIDQAVIEELRGAA